MIKKEVFKEKIGKSGINCFEIENCIDSLLEKQTLCLEDGNLDDLVRFAICNEIRTIFYFYIYNDENYFLIDEDDILEFDKEILEVMKQYMI